MKICKQCGRSLEEDQFRKTKSRSKGIYKDTKTGTKTICRACESLNIRAHNALKNNDEAAIAKLQEHYMRLLKAGHPPVSAAAQRIIGYAVQDSKADSNSLLNITDLLEHAAKVRSRSYASVDEADKVHRGLTVRLKEAGLYEEITDLLDDWYMEE